MKVRPLRLDELPRVSAAGQGTVRRAIARLGQGRRTTELATTPLGRVRLSCLEVTTAEVPDTSDAIWRLSRGGREGWLVLDGLGGLRVIAAILGLPAPRLHRGLGASERGILTSAIASFLRPMSLDLVLSPHAPRWRGEGMARLQIAVEAGTFRERARLDVPPEWIPPQPVAELVATANRSGLGISLAVQVGTTCLPAQDWSRARPGDAVVFDGHRAPRAGEDWPAELVCGASIAKIVITPQGRARVLDPFEPVTKIEREIMLNDEPRDTSDTLIASAPIEVVAEMARIVMRADELMALRPGSVLTLGSLRPTAVELRVGDRPWARGELVDVDGQLGVRLTSLARDFASPTSFDAETARYDNTAKDVPEGQE